MRWRVSDPPRLAQQQIGCRDVPFMASAMGKGAVQLARGDQGEAVGKRWYEFAHGDFRAECTDHRLVEFARAGHATHLRRRLRRKTPAIEKRAHTGPCGEQTLERRTEQNGNTGSPVTDDGCGDAPFRLAIDETACAVDRINDEDSVAAQP